MNDLTWVLRRSRRSRMIHILLTGATVPGAALPGTAFAQAAGSPFDTGAQSLLQFMLTIGAPIAALIIIGVCIAAAVGRVSWGAVAGTILGIAGIFGSVQIVTWIRGMFGV
jgi:type IV secretory pathway VirB2 component (pilin)